MEPRSLNPVVPVTLVVSVTNSGGPLDASDLEAFLKISSTERLELRVTEVDNDLDTISIRFPGTYSG